MRVKNERVHCRDGLHTTLPGPPLPPFVSRGLGNVLPSPASFAHASGPDLAAAVQLLQDLAVQFDANLSHSWPSDPLQAARGRPGWTPWLDAWHNILQQHLQVSFSCIQSSVAKTLAFSVVPHELLGD